LLNAFYSLLIAPLIEKGFAPEQYSRLIIVPHGPLQYVPFAALMDEHGVPLIKKTAVTMAPSASVWRLLLSRNAPVEKWVAYASPSLAAGLPTLASSQKEVGQISAIVTALHPVVKTGGEATAQNLAADAPTAGILHIATHGAFPDENALDDHALLLSASAGGDGILRASTVRHLPLQQTRLVVLSVCNGGLYRMGPTDEPYGLVPAFLEAGAQNVMATLWPMDDIFGRSFTVEFYKHLAKDGPAEALRQTTLHFFGEDELVRRWAGFVMVGPGRPLEYR
jgi:CHAT domain-containing protein